MTKINKIVAHGFKSFANKTELLLGDNFNCILGPNGSGKSNVGDAICFVLGRLGSKSLRAEKTANLVFNGGKKKKAADKGEVHIYFDNEKNAFPSEHKEVKVSRIIKKTGQSVYKINDKTHTRNEVVDLLGAARIDPDGFNIILQGDIMRFVEMSTNDRRQVVESISGISIYEERKHKALLELDKVEKKMNDAEIVLKERKVHLRELRKDRDQALKFKELKEGVDSNKATYLHLQRKGKDTIKERLEKDASQLKEKLTKSESQVTEFKTKIQEKKDDLQKLNEEIERKGEVEQVKLNKDVENLRVDIEKKKSRIEMIKDSLSKIKQRKQALSKDSQESDKRVIDLEEQKRELTKSKEEKQNHLTEVEKKVELFKKKNNLDRLGTVENDIEALNKDIEKKQEEIHKTRTEQQDLLREKDRLEYQIQTIDEQVKKVAEIEKSNKNQISELKTKKARFTQITKELNDYLDKDSKASATLATTRKELHILHDEKVKLEARQVHAKERVAGDIALKKIKALKKQGIHGTVAELGQVPKKYSLALELAAGGRLNSIVVDNDQIAAECITYLKKNKFGVATFIPLNKIKAPTIRKEVQSLTKNSGVHDLAINIIDFDKKFSKAFEYVFGDTLVVDSIDAARKIGIGKARMVTLEGDIADHSGTMRGGHHQKRMAGAFTESDSARELQTIEKKITQFNQQVADISKEKDRAEQIIHGLRKEKIDLESTVAKLEKTLHLGSEDLDASKQKKETILEEVKQVEKKLESFTETISSTNKELAQIKTKKEQLKVQVGQLRSPQLLAELSSFEEARQTARDALADIKNKISNADVQISNMVMPEKQRLGELIKGHEKEESNFTQEMARLQKEVKTGETELKQKEQILRKFFSAYKDLFGKRDRSGEEISKFEDRVDHIREQSRKVEIEMNNLSLKLASVKSELAGLTAQFEQFKDAKILRGKSEEELKAEISKFERLLATMSAVNMKALEIYEQVEIEYNKLLEKRETLFAEQKDVMGLMGEIETKKKEQFMKTFKEINNNFQTKFSMLSKKGNAYLQLENPDKPFDAGLDIKVRLMGQRYMDIKSLSGGEKTLTALAFIFSIQEYEPHSFYILDEVDAALDKHNSEKLAKLIREYCTKAQYLIISHNDSLISEADNLYGVSMDEFGVSKVVSLKV